MADRLTVWDAPMPAHAPADLDRTPDVLVIGGGAIGLSAAVFARRAGLGRVTLLERADRLAPGASTGNGGAIAPDMHEGTDSPQFVAFGRHSRDLYRELDAEWSGALGLWPARWLDIGTGPLDAAAVRALEPDVRLPEGATARLVEGQLGVNPVRLATALSAHAGQLATGVAMQGVTARAGRVTTVHTTAGDFSPGALILATGLLPPPWDAGVAQRWVKGHMLALSPGPWRLGSVLAGPYGGGTPLADGSIVCGGTFDEDLSPEVYPSVSDPMATALAALLPAASTATISHRWYCLRPYLEASQPVITRLPGLSNAWFAGGHFTTGIMMAPATGAALAEWIATGTTPGSVRTFTLPAA